jgi:hypothetical protein
VPDDTGRFQIAKGAVYSYYEFWRDAAAGRLTDEEWWELLINNPPDRPEWQQPLFAAGPAYDVGVEAGRECWTLQSEFSYAEIVAYAVAYGLPGRLDEDGNGRPCDEADVEVAVLFYAGLPEESGLFCRDLISRGYDFAQAVAYWLVEGAPDRMDADSDGIPCETVYTAADIEAFFKIGSG